MPPITKSLQTTLSGRVFRRFQTSTDLCSCRGTVGFDNKLNEEGFIVVCKLMCVHQKKQDLAFNPQK